MTVHAVEGARVPDRVRRQHGSGNRQFARADPGRGRRCKGEPSVAIADYQSEADEDSVAREREETKRLLYVALTRARDRLYLSGSVGGGVFRPTRGALAEVLPDSLRALFMRAAGGTDAVTWSGSAGTVHELVVPRRAAYKRTVPDSRIWTIGHSTRSLDDFVAMLRCARYSAPRGRAHGPRFEASSSFRWRGACRRSCGNRRRVRSMCRPSVGCGRRVQTPPTGLETRQLSRLRGSHADSGVCRRAGGTSRAAAADGDRADVCRSGVVALSSAAHRRRAGGARTSRCCTSCRPKSRSRTAFTAFARVIESRVDLSGATRLWRAAQRGAGLGFFPRGRDEHDRTVRAGFAGPREPRQSIADHVVRCARRREWGQVAVLPSSKIICGKSRRVSQFGRFSLRRPSAIT